MTTHHPTSSASAPHASSLRRAERTHMLLLLRRILRDLSRRRRTAILLLVTSVLYTLLSLVLPFLIGRAIDTVTASGAVAFSRLFPLLLFIAATAIAIALLQWAMTLINNKLSYETVHDLRSKAFRKINRLPLSYLDHQPTGDTVSRIISDTDQFAEGLTVGVTRLLSGLLTLLGTLVFLLILHPLTALLVAAITPISLVMTHFITKKSYRFFREQSQVRGDQTAFLEEMIAGQKLIHSFTAEQMVLRSFDTVNKRMLRTSRLTLFFSALNHCAAHFVHHMVLAVVCLTVPLAVIQGDATVGGLVALICYSELFAKPFHAISTTVGELQSALAGATRIFELLDQPEREDEDQLITLPDPIGHIVLDHVCFSYDGAADASIRDISLDIAPGEQVALVGGSGCGKTTLVHLLTGFYTPTSGTVSIDGYPLPRVSQASLLCGLGLSLQDTWLRSGTIRDNLTLGRPDVDDRTIVEAARRCRADTFIQRLPKGYDTVISDGGRELSAGQRQLLCITRAIITDPKILILDEATSSLDCRTETHVQAAIAEFARGRTCITAAHRLSTVLAADRILVMENGRITESGTHAELLARNGTYASLFHRQFGNEISENPV